MADIFKGRRSEMSSPSFNKYRNNIRSEFCNIFILFHNKSSRYYQANDSSQILQIGFKQYCI